MKPTNRRAVAAGLACAAALSTVVVAAPAANAAENRRICVYGWSIRDGGSPNERQKIYGVNYKKDGGCPKNTNKASRRDGAIGNANDGKWECEDVRDELGWGDNPCTEMLVDQVYVLETKGNGAVRERLQFKSFGSYRG